MNEVTSLYTRYQSYFPPKRSAIVVSTLYMGEIALPNQRVIMNKSFEKIPANAFYSVLKPSDPRSPGQGTVFIDGGRKSDCVYRGSRNTPMTEYKVREK